jgi:hypothetical protein
MPDFTVKLALAAPIYKEVVFMNKEHLISQVDSAPAV